jgi:hypothetical protein
VVFSGISLAQVVSCVKNSKKKWSLLLKNIWPIWLQTLCTVFL